MWGLIFIAGGCSVFCIQLNLHYFSNLLSIVILCFFGLMLYLGTRKCDCGKSSLPLRYRSRKRVMACYNMIFLVPAIVPAVLFVLACVLKVISYEFFGTVWTISGLFLVFLGMSGLLQNYLSRNSYTMQDLRETNNIGVEEASYMVEELVRAGELELADSLSKKLLISSESIGD